jgi:hypothetical protein
MTNAGFTTSVYMGSEGGGGNMAFKPLVEKHRDHSLTGEWKDHRSWPLLPTSVISLDIYHYVIYHGIYQTRCGNYEQKAGL